MDIATEDDFTDKEQQHHDNYLVPSLDNSLLPSLYNIIIYNIILYNLLLIYSNSHNIILYSL